MVNRSGLAVGLAVGVPVFLVIVGLGYFYTRTQRRQHKEEQFDDDVDLQLRDDASYTQFANELTKPMANNDDSQRSSTLTDSVQRYQQPPKYAQNQFYESFIPVMADGSSSSVLAPPPPVSQSPVAPRDAASVSSVGVPATPASTASLDKLAKNLSSNELFEKLPSRASAPGLPGVPSLKYRNSNHNSSSDILNTMVGESANPLNENYVYEAALPETERDKSRQALARQRSSTAGSKSPRSSLSQFSPKRGGHALTPNGNVNGNGGATPMAPNGSANGTVHTGSSFTDPNPIAEEEERSPSPFGPPLVEPTPAPVQPARAEPDTTMESAEPLQPTSRPTFVVSDDDRKSPFADASET
ncbi:hypothetical protein DICA1_E26786 [Diutina catenulata]